MTPHPVPLDGTLRSERQILIHRRMGCPYYAGCLNESVAQRWESFSCTHCPIAAEADALPHELRKYANQRKGDPLG